MNIETTFYNTHEVSHALYDFIISGEYKEILNNMASGEKIDFQQGFLQGVVWANIIISQCAMYSLKEEKKNG